jgi:hypothetical protein
MRVHIQNHADDGNPKASLDQWQAAAARAGAAAEGVEVSIGTNEAEFSAAMGEAQALITSGRVV